MGCHNSPSCGLAYVVWVNAWTTSDKPHLDNHALQYLG